MRCWRWRWRWASGYTIVSHKSLHLVLCDAAFALVRGFPYPSRLAERDWPLF
ncbi:hypothetical protein N431DRAFT_435224 [Stipitochalara longipes BDJ]|nr:hypothetical protein N431DRAFT_435224 [Stipitochalara longipes BDJ]